jgi:hypothetical protein
MVKSVKLYVGKYNLLQKQLMHEIYYYIYDVMERNHFRVQLNCNIDFTELLRNVQSRNLKDLTGVMYDLINMYLFNISFYVVHLTLYVFYFLIL